MERFELLSRLLLAEVSLDIPADLKHSAVAGIARFGAGAGGDLSFCDRAPGPELTSAPAGMFVLCSHALVDALRARFPGTIFVPLADPRAAFIDFCERVVEAGDAAVSDAVPRPFGVHDSARIGAQTVLHPETRVDEGVRVRAGCVIGRGTWIQKGTVVGDGVILGGRGMNAYVGQDGRRRGFPHLGSVIIGEGVEIGAGTQIARGILTSTIIGKRSQIGTLCSVGHGVRLGESVWMSQGCVIGGHSVIEAGAALGLRVVVRDNIVIGAGAQVAMGSVVTRSVDPGTSVLGHPARPGRPFRVAPDR